MRVPCQSLPTSLCRAVETWSWDRYSMAISIPSQVSDVYAYMSPKLSCVVLGSEWQLPCKITSCACMTVPPFIAYLLPSASHYHTSLFANNVCSQQTNLVSAFNNTDCCCGAGCTPGRADCRPLRSHQLLGLPACGDGGDGSWCPCNGRCFGLLCIGQLSVPHHTAVCGECCTPDGVVHLSGEHLPLHLPVYHHNVSSA